MNHYIQGDAAKADQIKAAFEKLGYNTGNLGFTSSQLYYTIEGRVELMCTKSLQNLIKTHPDYKKLELPIKPKFKAEDRIVNKSDKSTIYRIIALHEELQEYIVDIEHKNYYESCPWIVFEDQDDYELVSKTHYDIANFQPFDKVLVRDRDTYKWKADFFSHYAAECMFSCVGSLYKQCIPFEGNEALLGTTDMPSEEYINW